MRWKRRSIPDFGEPASGAVITGGAFDAEMTRLLGSTFDAAWEAVRASGRLSDDVGQQALGPFIVETVLGTADEQRTAASSG